MNTIKKTISILMVTVLLFSYIVTPINSNAQTTSDTTLTTSESDLAKETSDIESAPTETPTPTPIPTEIIIDSASSADLNNSASSSAITGQNTISDSEIPLENPNTTNTTSNQSSNVAQEQNTITTGDAASLVNQSTSVNSTSINSNIINQTLNILVASNGSINLSDPFTIAANAISSHPDESVINVLVTNVNNYSYITNEIASQAITGLNTITSNGSANINTGDAYSAVSLLNQVNFTVINSQIHIVTINIYGTLNGDIILPNINTSNNCDGCGISLATNNNATVINNINSIADSGNNSASSSASTITTGDSNSNVNILNLVNTNLFGTSAHVLFINNFGTWDGNFIGWNGLAPESGGGNLVIYSLTPSESNNCNCSTLLNASSSATVTNNINSYANTGGNSIDTKGNGVITTGNAFSLVSLINFINSNFINSTGFFGFINIFGNWIGDIGGKNEFDVLNTQISDTSNNQGQETSTSNIKEDGGILNVTNKNNVGKFVYPGDTVTFSIKVNNSGTGKVYDTKLILYLIKDGKLMGGTNFDMGDIEADKGKNLTTGFVLSKKSPGGIYIARAYVYGKTGPNDKIIESSSDSQFNIYGNFSYANSDNKITLPEKSVLGSQFPNTTNVKKDTALNIYLILFLLILGSYLTIKGVRNRNQLKEALIKDTSIKEKIGVFRILLL